MELNIYALRDRLVGYYLQPFCAPDDNNVKAALANIVNQGEKDAISQAPHHFEIWRLGKVTEEGDLVPGKEYVCGCQDLIRNTPNAEFLRGSVRERGKQDSAAPEGPKNESTGSPGGDSQDPAIIP